MRKKLVAANWKMNPEPGLALALAKSIVAQESSFKADVVLMPPLLPAKWRSF